MTLVQIVVFIVVLGLVLWLFNSQIPVPPWVKTVVNVLAVLFAMVWLLDYFGLGRAPWLHR